jgi:hypothetical protein
MALTWLLVNNILILYKSDADISGLYISRNAKFVLQTINRLLLLAFALLLINEQLRTICNRTHTNDFKIIMHNLLHANWL